jgi:acetyl-CoA carboxylase biotin carboxyl carrier protein
MSSSEVHVLKLKDILELIDKVADRGLAGLEIEQAGTRIRIEAKPPQPQVIHSYVGDARPEQPAFNPIPLAALPAPTPAALAAQAAADQRKADEDAEAGLHIITSPIVGTFYRAPNPEAESFVNVGDHVTKGKVLCIVEAMKLMNEIESEIDGTIVKIFPQNGQPIEYGEKLFAVKL